MLRTRPWVPYLYVAPAFALLALVFAYPVVRVVDFSTRLIRGASGPYVGSLNYQLVWEDPTFRDALKHSALLLLAVPVLTGLSIFFAVLLYEGARGWRVYRSVLFLPYILAVPIVGIVASYIFQLNGALNSILRAVGLDGLALDWLGSERLSLLTVGIVIVWREVGFGIILFLARLLTMDDEQLEAARIDGAGWWSQLRYIIVPELRGTIEFYVVVASITMLAWVFAYVYTITSGGPGTSSTVLELYIYNQGLRNSLPGHGVGGGGRPARRDAGGDHAALMLIRARAAQRRSSREAGLKTGRIVRQATLFAMAVLTLYPVWFMVSTAFKTQGQYLNSPYALALAALGRELRRRGARRDVLALVQKQRDPDARRGDRVDARRGARRLRDRPDAVDRARRAASRSAPR